MDHKALRGRVKVSPPSIHLLRNFLPLLTILSLVQSSCTGLEMFSRQKWQGGSGVTSSLKCSTPSRSGCSRISGTAAELPFRSGMRPSFGSQSELQAESEFRKMCKWLN